MALSVFSTNIFYETNTISLYNNSLVVSRFEVYNVQNYQRKKLSL